MKKFLRLAILAQLLVVGISIPVNAQSRSIALGDAESLVKRYCTYLETGNTTAILDVLGGALLQKRADLLKNDATYGRSLSNHYKNAEFKIEDSRSIADTKAAVDLSVIFENGDVQKIRLIVEPISDSLKIVDEGEPN